MEEFLVFEKLLQTLECLYSASLPIPPYVTGPYESLKTSILYNQASVGPAEDV